MCVSMYTYMLFFKKKKKFISKMSYRKPRVVARCSKYKTLIWKCFRFFSTVSNAYAGKLSSFLRHNLIQMFEVLHYILH